jgi:hypothetical protein
MSIKDDPEVLAHLAEVLVKRGRGDEARKLIANGLRKNPGNSVLQAAQSRLVPDRGGVAGSPCGLALPGGGALLPPALLTSLLVACASAPRAPEPATPTSSAERALFASDGTRRFSANMRWTQAGSTRILLTTPLGQAVASIEADSRRRRADRRRWPPVHRGQPLRTGTTGPRPGTCRWNDCHGGSAAAPPPTRWSSARPTASRRRLDRALRGARDGAGRPLRLEAECDPPCAASAGGQPAGAPGVRLIIDQWLEP